MQIFNHPDLYRLIYKIKENINKIINYFCENYYDDKDVKSRKFIIEIFKELFMKELEKILKNDFESLIDKSKDLRLNQLKETIELFEQLANDEIDKFIAQQIADGIVNKRNGYRTRVIATIFGNATIKIPRDRLSQFVPSFMIKHFKLLKWNLLTVVQMLKELNNQSKVKSLLSSININLSKYSITKIWNAMYEKSYEAYYNQQLPEKIDKIELDATYTYVKEYEDKTPYFESINQITGEVTSIYKGKKVAILQAFGYNLAEDKKYDLGFVTCDNEDVEGYVNLLTEIQKRGVKEIGILVSDKHPAIKTAMNLIYPECTNFQQCFIHAKRSLLQSVRGRKNKMIINRIFDYVKSIPLNTDCWSTIYSYISELDMSSKMMKQIEKWFLNNYDTLTTFKKYHISYWKKLYTSNNIESQNKRLKVSNKIKSCSYNSTTLNKNILVSKCIFSKLI